MITELAQNAINAKMVNQKYRWSKDYREINAIMEAPQVRKKIMRARLTTDQRIRQNTWKPRKDMEYLYFTFNKKSIVVY